MTISNPFTLWGDPGNLPAGDYENLVEEELLQGPSFEAYRGTATYPAVRGEHARVGRNELRVRTEVDLKDALSRDQVMTKTNNHSVAALSPQEDLK